MSDKDDAGAASNYAAVKPNPPTPGKDAGRTKSGVNPMNSGGIPNVKTNGYYNNGKFDISGK